MANPNPPPADWDSVLAAFEAWLAGKGRSESTHANYTRALREFGGFYRDGLGKPGPHPQRLQPTDLHAYVDYLQEKRLLSFASINLRISALKTFARFLLETRWNRRDIAREVRTFGAVAPPPAKRLTREETRRFLASVNLNARNGPRDLAILQLFLQCGLRLGELARLLIDDAALGEASGHLRIRDRKTRSERLVPLNASARKALRDYLATRGGAPPGEEPLFLSERGQRISPKSVQHLVKKHLAAAGRADLSVHGLRHHFASTLYDRTRDLTALQELLGHRRIATTARYARRSPEEIAGMVEDLPQNVYHPGLKEKRSA